MIDWPNIERVLVSQLAFLAGMKPTDIANADAAEAGAWGSATVLYYEISTAQGVGYGETLRVDSPDASADQTVTTALGKEFTVSLWADSFAAKPRDPLWAGNILQNIETRIFRESANNYRGNVFVVNDTMTMKKIRGRSADGRIVVRYAMDLLCSCLDVDVDTSLGAGGYFTEVSGTGVVTADGTADPVTFDQKGS